MSAGSPRELSEEQLQLSSEYQTASTEAGEIASKKDLEWLALRKTCDSDKECDRRWGATPEGRRETYLRFYMKGLEKRMSAIKAHLRILDVEAHNTF